jgi:nicotinamide phosphoribosyltransferase
MNKTLEAPILSIESLQAEIARITRLLLPTQRNPLLALDVYKMGHMEQYAPGCNKVRSSLVARTDAKYRATVFFGLQYYLKTYLSTPLTREMGYEFLEYRKMILGQENPQEIVDRIMALCDLGYWPLEITAVPEGTVMSVQNILMEMTNTLDDFHWAVGYIESLIIKIWDPITTAACSLTYRQVVEDAFARTVSSDLQFLKQFMVHDFGYRGSKTEEEACLTGAAHLLSFTGSDTVPALPFVLEQYHANRNNLIMASVPASEHSVACSFGRDQELAYFRNMLRLYPTGIVSMVSDTYNVYKVLTVFARALKDEILARDGKTVFRPDSGNPEYIICGDPSAPVGSPEWKGAIRLLDEIFGSTINEKGFKELNPKVGLIYGDGMYLERYVRTLNRLEELGYAASNLVIGVGGILRFHSRDTMGFALKATYVEVNGEPREIEKDPVTDYKKKSYKGLVALRKTPDGDYYTVDQCTQEEAKDTLLIPVYRNGSVLVEYTLEEIRERVSQYFAI